MIYTLLKEFCICINYTIDAYGSWSLTHVYIYIYIYWGNWSTKSQILTFHQILEGVCAKNRKATLLFVDFFKAFDSIHRGKMDQTLLAYGVSKETVTAIIMQYKNITVKVCSPDGDTDFFDIVGGILQGNTLTSYLFIICLDYKLWMSIDLMKENGLLEKARSRQYFTLIT